MAVGATLFDLYESTASATDSFTTTNSLTPDANTTYLVGVELASGSGIAWPTVTLSGWGITWSQCAAPLTRATADLLVVFEGQTASPSNGVLTVTYTGKALGGKSVVAVKITGDDTADPVIGTPGTVGYTNSGGPATASLSGYTASGNAAIAFFDISVASTTDVTAETDWTEIVDAKYDTPNHHLQCQFRADAGSIPDTSCTATWDGSSVQHAGIIFELAVAAAGGGGNPYYAYRQQ